MRDLVIVIADLYLSQQAAALPAVTLAGIEHAGRFGERALLERGWQEWLAGSLGRADLAGAAPACIAGACVAPQTSPADPGAADTARVSATQWIATPLHLSASASRLQLDHRGLLRLPPAELAPLAAAFHATFASSGFTLAPLACGEFLLATPGIAALTTTEPARCAGGDLAQALPRGAGAAPLRRLLAEIEMWLHGLALNEARASRGEVPVTTLWPWGAAGRVLHPERRQMRERWSAFGSDPYLCGLWHLQGGACRAIPQHLDEVLAERQAVGAVVVLEMGRELHSSGQDTLAEGLARLDARFVSPALAALRRGELASVTLIASDQRVRLRRRSHLRLWRRARAGLGGFA